MSINTRAFLIIILVNLAIIAAVFVSGLHSPAPALAGPGAEFVKLDLLPETMDPFDLYFNFSFLRYMRPGGMLEIPRSHFIETYKSAAADAGKLVKRLKITMNKKGEHKWYSFFAPFYNGKNITCEYDRSQKLTKATMIDESGEVCIQNINSFDDAGRLTAETSEVFDRVFGHDGSGSIDDRRPRTGKLIFKRTVKHSYSPKGLLIRSDFKNLETEGYFEYERDSSENLIKLSCYAKEYKKPYYIFEYCYDEKGRLSKIKWFNGQKDELEMYYEYIYDEKGNCVKIKCPVYLTPEREDGRLENDFKYDNLNRVTDVVYYNWFNSPVRKRPDSLIRCSYGENGLLSEIEVEPAQMNPGEKFIFKYSYELY